MARPIFMGEPVTIRAPLVSWFFLILLLLLTAADPREITFPLWVRPSLTPVIDPTTGTRTLSPPPSLFYRTRHGCTMEKNHQTSWDRLWTHA